MDGSEDRRTVWLLDVDGVLNATRRGRDESVWPTWRTGRARASGISWSITWAPPVVQAIRRIHAAGRTDIRWLTTWLEEANDSLGRLLGLPVLPVLDEPDGAGAPRGPHGFLGVRGEPTGWWKLEAARRLLDPQPDRPLVWTDDDLAREDGARAWAERRSGPTLLIAPDTDTGLAPDHVAAIEEFCARY
jgi:hypothetical protein